MATLEVDGITSSTHHEGVYGDLTVYTRELFDLLYDHEGDGDLEHWPSELEGKVPWCCNPTAIGAGYRSTHQHTSRHLLRFDAVSVSKWSVKDKLPTPSWWANVERELRADRLQEEIEEQG